MAVKVTWVRYGPSALLFRFADKVNETAFARGRAIARMLEEHAPPGLIEFVPAFTSVLLEFDPRLVPDVTAIAADLANKLERIGRTKLRPAPIKEIPIRYDGPDLARVAELHKLTVKEVCELHARPVYKVYALGFSPGFPYLGDLNPRLHTPRLAVPRPRVRAGAVAIGGEHTGIYTVDGPGGWNILGHTPPTIFDPARGQAAGQEIEMFLLRPGDQVKFVPVAKPSD